ncbi:MAG: hypothetical protein DKT66_26155 [Candidatus Melainabacteria bacterium]|nr:MAG: hypothetical protein DKT66_26155 [Candidatus Melainabacteria bacterium]
MSKYPHKLIPLLSATNRLLLSFVLSLWLINWLSKAWERIGCAQQFYADWGVGLQDLAIASVIAVLIGCIALCAKKERRLFALEKDWTTILQQSRLLSGLRVSYLFASCITLLIFSAFFSTCIFDNSAKALACLMSDVGQYELAERIYRSAPDLNHNKASGRYSSMAAWHSSSTREDPNTLRMKNAAVAAVYGSQSRQMAGRYFYLGLTCEQGRENRDPEAIYWHNKALLLYQQNHAVTKCVDALAQMAILQDESNKQESKRLLAQAARLMPSIDEEPFVCTPIIQYLAQRNGDKEQSELFRRSFEKHRTPAESTPWWPDVSLTLFAIFGSSVGSLLAKEQAVAALTGRTARNCSKVTNVQALIELLTQLITLNLIRGNSEAAEHNSLLLLALAEGHRSLIAARQGIASAIATRLAPVCRFELLRVLLALAIAWSFYV